MIKTLWFFCCIIAAAPGLATAQAYPSKPIRIVVGFAPGGGSDVMARLVAAKLGDAFKQQVIVENRPGANGNVAAEYVSQTAPDGYTILMVSVSHAISRSLYKNLKYDFVRDFQGVSSIASVANVVVVHPSMPARSLEDLIALARSKPGEVAYASSGSGSPEHIAAELLASMANLRMVHVPYKGGSASANDIIGGQILLGFNTMPVALPHIKSGRMRALAVTDDKRSAALPDIPTVAQAGLPGYAMSTWYGMTVPSATPKEITAQLNLEINRILRLPDVKERFATLGAEPTGGTVETFGSYIRSEVMKYSKLVADAKLQADQ